MWSEANGFGSQKGEPTESLIFGKSYERLGAHSAPRESCRVCSRSLALALSVECLRKSCKPQLDVSRVVCLWPHADQALLAFAARFWCLEVGLLNLLSQALNKRTGVLPSLLCCRVGSLSGLQCQGLGTVAPHRTTWFMLRPSRAGLQRERCLALSRSAAIPPGKRARQDCRRIHW